MEVQVIRPFWISLLVLACAGPPAGYPELMGHPPGSFALRTPADGATGVSSAPDFQWFDSEGATSYRFQLGRDLATPDVDFELTYPYTSVSTPLQPATTYFWRVIAESQEGTAVAGPSSFTTR